MRKRAPLGYLCGVGKRGRKGGEFPEKCGENVYKKGDGFFEKNCGQSRGLSDRGSRGPFPEKEQMARTPSVARMRPSMVIYVPYVPVRHILSGHYLWGCEWGRKGWGAAGAEAAAGGEGEGEGGGGEAIDAEEASDERVWARRGGRAIGQGRNAGGSPMMGMG